MIQMFLQNETLLHKQMSPYRFEPRHEKTGLLPNMRKQRRRSASQYSVTYYNFSSFSIRNFKLLVTCACTARFVSDLIGNPEDRFSRDVAHLAPD